MTSSLSLIPYKRAMDEDRHKSKIIAIVVTSAMTLNGQNITHTMSVDPKTFNSRM